MNGYYGENLIKEAYETSKAYYSDKANVTRKYIEKYSAMSISDDYFCNKNCLSEVFNMLDIIAQMRLEEFENKSERLPDSTDRKHRIYVVYRYEGRVVSYFQPRSFSNRIFALRRYGVNIPESIDKVVRVVRNFTTHGNATVVLDIKPLNYNDTRKMMLIMADALIEMDVLDYEDRIPSFEKMRVRPADKLHGGEYTVGNFVQDYTAFRVYEGTKTRLAKKLLITELKPGMFAEKENKMPDFPAMGLDFPIYDLFSENGTFYLISEEQKALSSDPEMNVPDVPAMLHQQGKGRHIFRSARTKNVTYSVYTDPGDRDINEDRTGICIRQDAICFVLCDGLGGHKMGGTAASLAVETFKDLFSKCSDISGYLRDAFSAAQDIITAEQMSCHGEKKMKTTCAALVIGCGNAFIGHVGDSRVYIFGKEKMMKRTLDHSVSQMLALTGDIKEDEIRFHSERNILLRVMGDKWEHPMQELMKPVSLRKCRAFLLCSDGFWELIEEKEMCRLLDSTGTVKEWLDAMSDVVRKNGTGNSMDNNTAIAVWIE